MLRRSLKEPTVNATGDKDNDPDLGEPCITSQQVPEHLNKKQQEKHCAVYAMALHMGGKAWNMAPWLIKVNKDSRAAK